MQKKTEFRGKKIVYRINSGRSVFGGFGQVLARFWKCLEKFWGGFGDKNAKKNRV